MPNAHPRAPRPYAQSPTRIRSREVGSEPVNADIFGIKIIFDTLAAALFAKT